MHLGLSALVVLSSCCHLASTHPSCGVLMVRRCFRSTHGPRLTSRLLTGRLCGFRMLLGIAIAEHAPYFGRWTCSKHRILYAAGPRPHGCLSVSTLCAFLLCHADHCAAKKYVGAWSACCRTLCLIARLTCCSLPRPCLPHIRHPLQAVWCVTAASCEPAVMAHMFHPSSVWL